MSIQDPAWSETGGRGDGAGMVYERIPPEHRDLFGIRTDTPYTPSERKYGAMLQLCLDEMLQGRRAEIFLLRRYHDGRERIQVPPAPPGVERGELRMVMVERILTSVIAFMRDVSPGGPILQRERRGRIVETQQFSTKHPHIVIERQDDFDAATRAPVCTEWRLRRTQNQRAETRINRWLDAANLVLGFLEAVRPRR